MQKLNNELYISLFRKYNEIYSKAWDRRLAREPVHGQVDDNQAEMENEIQNDIQNWHEMPVSSDKPQSTFGCIIRDIADPDTALELARHAAAYCDSEIPDIVKIKLGSFGSGICRLLLKNILILDWESPPDEKADTPETDQEILVSTAFLKLLGEWDYRDGTQAILDKFTRLSLPRERIAEEVRAYAVRLDPAPTAEIIEYIRKSIREKADLGPAQEYLLIILTDIGKIWPEDDIFNCIKDCFRKMSNKAIGAICLGDYGDGRAIPALRGYLEKNPQMSDRQVLAEVLSAIRRLGGDIAGLQKPLIS
jgi:hypothetical protein